MRLDLHKHSDDIKELVLNIEKSFENLENLNIQNYDVNSTAIVFVDIIEGFVNVGTLSSPRAKDILKYVKYLNENSSEFHKIYFVDTHNEDAEEFRTYPPHCIVNTQEAVLAKELLVDKNNSKSVVIEKNSTNGFLAPQFQKWLEDNSQVENFIITGLVTDICVMQFALTLKTAFNEKNKKSNLVIPIQCIETFDLAATNHHASLMNLFAIYNMQMNGVKFVNLNI